MKNEFDNLISIDEVKSNSKDECVFYTNPNIKEYTVANQYTSSDFVKLKAEINDIPPTESLSCPLEKQKFYNSEIKRMKNDIESKKNAIGKLVGLKENMTDLVQEISFKNNYSKQTLESLRLLNNERQSLMFNIPVYVTPSKVRLEDDYHINIISDNKKAFNDTSKYNTNSDRDCPFSHKIHMISTTYDTNNIPN